MIKNLVKYLVETFFKIKLCKECKSRVVLKYNATCDFCSYKVFPKKSRKIIKKNWKN